MGDFPAGVVKGGRIGYVALMRIDYTVQVWREDGQFIAHAMPLDVASSGPTPEAARQAVDEAVRLFLATAAEHGTLTEVLEDAG
jgi:predicted RNase H-like HicB family nuclease